MIDRSPTKIVSQTNCRRHIKKALYNLGRGSWLALAIVLRRKLAAPIVPATDCEPAFMHPDVRYYAPISHARPSPRNPRRNYMDHYSFTDPWGMDGWVGHVGWPIADGLTTNVGKCEQIVPRHIEDRRRR